MNNMNIKKIAIILEDSKDTDILIQKLEILSKDIYDVFVVNNCEDIKSKYVNIKLNKKVVFPNNIFMGLYYSDTFKIIKKIEYVAYCFINVNADLSFILNSTTNILSDYLTKIQNINTNGILIDYNGNLNEINTIHEQFSFNNNILCFYDALHFNNQRNIILKQETVFDEKLNKVAVIIVNYNMVERTNQIVEYLKNNIHHPHDIIVVDNGTLLVNKSQYTLLDLKENIQTTNGWLMGLHYADSIENTTGQKYYAYCFVITSMKMVNNKKDILTTMVNTLTRDNQVVGIHPSLTSDSTLPWKNMKNKNGIELEQLFFIDNNFSCYRASWFNKIGRFTPLQTYAWGIDIETGYIASMQNKKIIVDHTILVKKEQDIGYKMNRMGMTSAKRKENAQNQSHEYLRNKYGKNFEKILFTRLQETKRYMFEYKFNTVLKNIPKILHLYWGNNEKLSFLHYLTVKSFRIHNPDWKIKIYTPIKTFYKNTWKCKAQKEKYTGDDHSDKINKLNVEKIEIDFDKIGFKNDASEVFKSDYFRYYILYNEGGVWSDFDVIYIKPMNQIILTNPIIYGDSNNINTCFSYFNNHYSIGFLISSQYNLFYKELMDNCLKYYDLTYYESLGIRMIQSIFGVPTTIKNRIPSSNVLLLPESFYLPYNYDTISEIFYKNNPSKIKPDTVGIHWFNGATPARNFVNTFPNGNFSKTGSIYPYLKFLTSPNSLENII